jgi:hypothetical protein
VTTRIDVLRTRSRTLAGIATAGAAAALLAACGASTGAGSLSLPTLPAGLGVGLPPGVTVVKIGYRTEGVAGVDIPAKLWWTVADSGASAPNATPTDTPEATPTDTPGSTPTATPST